MKVYLAIKRSFGNFDCEFREVVVAGNQDMIEAEVRKLNGKRSKQELKDEVEYVSESVKWIG